MREKSIIYTVDNFSFNGLIVYPSQSKDPRPGIILAHAWRGQDDFVRQKARELAQLGYVAFVADVYGNGQCVDNNEAALNLMLPLFLDRALLQKRIGAAYEQLVKQEGVDKKKIGAIGFCFGGLTVIELLRSGLPLRAVVSFHGVLGNTLGDHKAKQVPIAPKITGSLLILHGHEDPLVSPSDIKNMQMEFTDAGVDWQMMIYGQTKHAFTNPAADDPSMGLKYNPRSARRAWQAMKNFFEEFFD